MIKKPFIKAWTVVASLAILFVMMCGSVNILASTAYTGMRDITSLELVNEMRVGWNLGLSLIHILFRKISSSCLFVGGIV